jgi:hypothetical protein
MRSLGIWVLAASIGLIGVLVWQVTVGWPRWMPQPASTVTSRPKVAVSKEKKSVHGRVSKKSAPDPAAAEISLPSELVSRNKVAAPPTSVPDSEDMEVGITRSELRKRYGMPTFAVSSVRDGGLFERYYYLKPDRANLVVATLREGKLIAAETAKVWQPVHNFLDPGLE